MAIKSVFIDPDQVDSTALSKAGILAYRTNSNLISSYEVTYDKDGYIKTAKLHQLLLAANGCQYMVDGKKKLSMMTYNIANAINFKLKAGSDIPVKDVNTLTDFMSAIISGNCDLQGNNWYEIIANAYLYCKVTTDGSLQQLNFDYWLHHLSLASKEDIEIIISKIAHSLNKDQVMALNKIGTNQDTDNDDQDNDIAA